MDNRPQVKTKRVDVNDFLEPGNDGTGLGNAQPSPGNPNINNMQGNDQPLNQQGYAPNNRQQNQQQNNKGPSNHLKDRKSKKKSAGPNKVMIVVITIVIILSIAIIGIVGTRTLSQLNNKEEGNGSTTNTDASINVDNSTSSGDMPSLTPGSGTGNLEPSTGNSGLTPGNATSNSITPGMTNTGEDTTMDQTSPPEEDSMVKDLNGISLIQNYTVGEITTVVDFINYTKHRAITADGMELLWLEVDYKGKPYKVTVPFKIYKELDPEGITVVDIEVLNLGNGNQVISHMSVRSDYKKKLENGLR